MKRTTWILGATLLAACVDGIAGTKTGNPDAQVQIRMTAWSSNQEVATLPHPQGLTTGVVVTRALVGVEELEFVRPQPDGSCNPALADDDDGLEIESLFVADLVQGTLLDPRKISKEFAFCAVGLSLEDGDDFPPGTAGAELLGEASLYVEGTRADGIRFEVRSENIDELPILLPSLRTFERDQEVYALAFDVAAWFAEVDLEGATVTDGVILIDESNNQGQLAQFEAAVGASVGLCRDDEEFEMCEVDDDDDDED